MFTTQSDSYVVLYFQTKKWKKSRQIIAGFLPVKFFCEIINLYLPEFPSKGLVSSNNSRPIGLRGDNIENLKWGKKWSWIDVVICSFITVDGFWNISHCILTIFFKKSHFFDRLFIFDNFVLFTQINWNPSILLKTSRNMKRTWIKSLVAKEVASKNSRYH